MKPNAAKLIAVGCVALGLAVPALFQTQPTAAQDAPDITPTASRAPTSTATTSPTRPPSPTLTPTPTPTGSPSATSAPTLTPSTATKIFLPFVLKPLEPQLVGALNVLKINVNPIGAGGTAYTSWSISNFREGEFDRGDGKGYIGPIASAMTVDVPNLMTNRTLRLRWRNLSGQQFEDTLLLFVDGSIPTPVPTPTPALEECNSANPDWRGNGTAAYTFCVRQDMQYLDGGAPIRNFTYKQDAPLTLSWHVYGINGIRFLVEPVAAFCNKAGTSVIDLPTVGQGSYTFNINQLETGGYIIHLQITRRDNVQVNYNEKFVCIGSTGSNATETPGPTSTAFPLTPMPTNDVPATAIP